MNNPKMKLVLLAGCAIFALGGCSYFGWGHKDADVITPTPTPTPLPTPVPTPTPQMTPTPPPPPPAPVSVQSKYMTGAAQSRLMAMPAPIVVQPKIDRERYEDFDENPVKSVAKDPVSTFSIDVDTASYSLVRRELNAGYLPRKDAVRVEELINYFDYTYPTPKESDPPFSTNVSIAPSPWADGNMLMQIGLKGYEIPASERPPINLTLLIDVSGSMSYENKLPLAKKALKLLVDQLSDKDTVSIAVYAGAAGTVLEPTKGSDKGKILEALDKLSAGGSTAGGEGLRLAYDLAEKNFSKDGVNRVMLLTDGDFNVGVTQDEALEDFVARKRETGVFLSVMGFGEGNYNDQMMQKISQAGNGMAAYVDTLNEARKLLSDDLAGSLFTIGKDVKIQVEFNPYRVKEYRLIGYETRMLEEADFNNDKVDAGEIGAGHTVTAIYEITPTTSKSGLIDEHRYSNNQKDEVERNKVTEWAYLKLRYKKPDEDKSNLVTIPIRNNVVSKKLEDAPQYARFATAVAGYGQLLKGSPFIQNDFSYDDVISLAQTARGEDEFGYRAEFVQLARAAKTAEAQEPLDTGKPTEK